MLFFDACSTQIYVCVISEMAFISEGFVIMFVCLSIACSGFESICFYTHIAQHLTKRKTMTLSVNLIVGTVKTCWRLFVYGR